MENDELWHDKFMIQFTYILKAILSSFLTIPSNIEANILWLQVPIYDRMLV